MPVAWWFLGHHPHYRVSPSSFQVHGFLATTFPFSHTYIGVPYMRAVLRADWAARRSAIPICFAKSSVGFLMRVAVMVLSPKSLVLGLNYRISPS
jgi:hypothetical protein